MAPKVTVQSPMFGGQAGRWKGRGKVLNTQQQCLTDPGQDNRIALGQVPRSLLFAKNLQKALILTAFRGALLKLAMKASRLAFCCIKRSDKRANSE